MSSNGFPGYSPAFSDDYDRDSFAVYLDLSADVSENLFLQGAVRYEDYSDFGNETVGKVAARYRLSEKFAIRGSLGTGFRAPTPGQQGTTNVSTRLPNGFPVATGLFPAGGAVAQALGASPLKAETSTNMTFGFTADLEDITLTVDFYKIEIEDRFNAISTRDVSSTAAVGTDARNNFEALQAAGVAGANTIGGVFYFTNAFDTDTNGVDIVASMPIEWDNGMNTNLTASVNYNEQNIQGDASAFFNVESQYDFENAFPNWRSVVTANHYFNNALSMMVRASYFGEETNSDRSACSAASRPSSPWSSGISKAPTASTRTSRSRSVVGISSTSIPMRLIGFVATTTSAVVGSTLPRPLCPGRVATTTRVSALTSKPLRGALAPHRLERKGLPRAALFLTVKAERCGRKVFAEFSLTDPVAEGAQCLRQSEVL